MAQDRVFVGVDVSKDRLDVAVLEGEVFAVANDTAGLRDLIKRLKAVKAGLIGLEATGGYIEGFCNSRRLHSALGYISPAEMERRAA